MTQADPTTAVGVRLMLGDCLDVMRGMPDASVDAVITDPPYGTTCCEWDNVPDWAEWWPEVRRVCRPDAFVVLFGEMPGAIDCISSVRRSFKYDLIGHKSNATGFLNVAHRPMRAHELILVFAFGSPKYNRVDWPAPAGRKCQGKTYAFVAGDSDVYGKQGGKHPFTYGPTVAPKSVVPMVRSNFRSRSRESGHPTGKPLSTMTWLVEAYSPPDGVVFDPYLGGGTTGVACLNAGRRFIGIEKDPDYFAVAERRVAAALEEKR